MEPLDINQLANVIAGELGMPLGLLAIVAFWALPWKGYALWTAATRKEKWWFIALLVVNTMALLEIFYLLKIAKKKGEIFAFCKSALKKVRGKGI